MFLFFDFIEFLALYSFFAAVIYLYVYFVKHICCCIRWWLSNGFSSNAACVTVILDIFGHYYVVKSL